MSTEVWPVQTAWRGARQRDDRLRVWTKPSAAAQAITGELSAPSKPSSPSESSGLRTVDLKLHSKEPARQRLILQLLRGQLAKRAGDVQRAQILAAEAGAGDELRRQRDLTNKRPCLIVARDLCAAPAGNPDVGDRCHRERRRPRHAAARAQQGPAHRCADHMHDARYAAHRFR